MDITNSKPRGRPATGRAKDGVLFVRLPKEDRDRVKRLVDDWINKSTVKVDIMPANQPLNAYPSKEAHDATQYLTEISQLKADQKDLLDDIERLTKELEEERGKVKRALEMDLDEKGKMGWRLYFKLKEGSGKSEHDQT